MGEAVERLILLSQVRAHTRKTPSGKVVQVVGYEKHTPISAETVGPVYNELRALLPQGSRFGLAMRKDALELDLIQVPKSERGKGHASKVLQRLTDIADEKKWPLVLHIGDLGEDPKKLVTLYSRFGFVRQDASERPVMTRKPRG